MLENRYCRLGCCGRHAPSNKHAQTVFIMAALCSRAGIIYLPSGFFFCLSIFCLLLFLA